MVYTADHGASFLGKGHVYEAGVRVPLLVRWPPHTPLASARRSATNVALLDLAPTILAVAGAAEPDRAGLHGRSLVPLLTSDAGSVEPGTGGGGASDGAARLWQQERPIFVEIGYGRAVIRGPWKLVVVNDPIDRCAPPVDGTCRNLHGEAIDRYQCNFTANGHMGNRLTGACNMTYDAVARHAGFCDRRQLYNLDDDPLEQRNVVDAHPQLYDELLQLILRHVRAVEEANPALKSKIAGDTLNMCGRTGARRGLRQGRGRPGLS